MEILGTLGYSGESIEFISPETICYSSGNGLCVIETNKGPKDIIWRSEKGIQCWSSHQITNQLVIAPKIDGGFITLYSLLTSQVITNLTNPAGGKIIHFSFSGDGTYLLALSDSTDHKVIMWNVTTHQVLFCIDLPSNCEKCLMHPADNLTFLLYGSESILYCHMLEILGNYDVKMHPIMIKMESKYSTSTLISPSSLNNNNNSNNDEPEFYQGITCATWSPPSNIIVGTNDGSIFVIEPISKYTKKLFSIPSKSSERIELIQPISLVLIGINLIIGIGKCQIYWYTFDPFDLTAELLENESHFQEIISSEPDQILTLESDNDNIPSTSSSAAASSFEINGDTHYLTCLVCDTSDYLSCIASTSDGMIYKFSSEIQHLTNDDDGDDEGHEQSKHQQNQKPVLLNYSPLYTLHSGAIISTHTMSLPISEYASSQNALNTKNDGVILSFDHAESVNVFITGSYTGAVSFWRILGPNEHGSNVSNSVAPSTQTKSPTGIIKSIPRIPQRLCRKYVCDKVELDQDINTIPHVITSFETLSLATYGGGRLLVVGTMTGWIEIWRVEGYINEDTKPDDNVGNENALDEEDALRDITIGIQLVYRRRFYETAITSISSSEVMSCFAISSYNSHLIYVLNTSPKNKFQEVKVYTLGDNTNKPVNLSWNGPLLWVPTHEGIFFTFLPELNHDDQNSNNTTNINNNNNNNNIITNGSESNRGSGSVSPIPMTPSNINNNINNNGNNDNDDEVLKIAPALVEMTPIHPKVMWEIDSKSIGNALPLNGSGGGCMFTKQDISMIGLIDNYPTIFDLEHNNLLHSDYQPGEVPEVPMLQMPGNLKYSIPMSSPIISLAKAPNSQVVATGTLDGSIFLWKIKRGEISLINRYQPHCCAVINLLFTIDSSQVISSGIDGSVFITLVDKPTQLNIPVVSLLLENDLFDMKQLGTVSSKKMLWKDQHHNEVMNQLKETFKSKSIHFQSIVENIENRLKTLLTRNQDANELEKMDLSEFVIDVKRKEEIINNNNQKANKVREMYELKNSINELIAARIRQQCWDTMEVHSITILPIQDNIKDFLTSYSIEKYTEIQRSKLERIKRLRAIEITSQRITLQSKGGGHIDKVGTGGNWRCCWGKNIQGTPNVISWLFNDGIRWPCQDIVKLILEQEKNNNSTKENSEGGNNSSNNNNSGQGPNSSPVKEIKDDKKKLNNNNNSNNNNKSNNNQNTTTTTTTNNNNNSNPNTTNNNTTTTGNNNNNNNNNTTTINIVNSKSNNIDEDDENSYSGDMITLEQEIDFNNIFNLLYSPQTVRTQIQKRNQIIFLKEIIRLIKINFNKYFDKLYHEKEDVMINIQSKNIRINEIITELEINDDGSGIIPKWNDIELPDSTIRILDNEISSRPYETNAMKLQRLAEEERKRKEAEERNNDGKERALHDMMNGTLEVKRDVLSEASSLQKPEWMNTINYEHMTDTQKKEFEEYQTKYNAIQDERAKYRKSLEVEMKKLKVEIQDIVKGFDDKLIQMIKLKILIQREILANELYISRLALSMVKREQCWSMLKDVEKEIEKNRLKRIEVSSKIDKLTLATEEAKIQLTNFQDEEKVLDRSFKRDLQTLCNTTFDQDLLKLFTQLYRLRKYQDTGFLSNEEDSDHNTGAMDGRSSRNSTKRRMSLKRSMGSSKGQSRGVTHRRSKGNSVSNRGDSLGPMQTAAKEILEQEAGISKQPTINIKNPFYSNLIAQDREKKIQESQLPLLQPLSIDVDTPEGFSIDPFVWSKLQELRLNRISKEIAVKGQLKTYTELKKKLEILTNEEDEIHTTAIQLRKKRENILERMKELMDDLEIIISVKQGQDEVDSDVVVTDYNQSKLIPTSIIQKYNNRINELGKEKINILSKIKQFRRKMNLVDWEAKHLQLEGWHLEEYYTDSQLFRVTRDLQRVIKDGINYELNKNKYDKILIRKEFIKKDSENKITKMNQLIENIKLQMNERIDENIKLSAKINVLKGEVAVREQVIRASTAATGGGGDNDNNYHNNNNNNEFKTSDDILLSKTAPIKSSKLDLKMKKIVKRRKLIDTARIQSEEIDYLKQELDKLRQKTFPSFVRATRNRLIYNPDERI